MLYLLILAHRLSKLSWFSSIVPNGFDFAYIDADHRAPNVLMDSLLVWRVLKVGGRIIWDDVLWPAPGYSPTHKPEIAVRAFLQCFAEKVKVIADGYQVCIEKLGD